MSGTQQTEMLNSGLDCFQDPDRARHSVRHLLMGTDLILPAVRAQDVKFCSKKHLQINVKCDRACSEFQERGEPSVGDSRTPKFGVVLAPNTSTLAGRQLPCSTNVNIPDLIPMKPSLHWFLHSTSPVLFFLHLPYLPFHWQIPDPSRAAGWAQSCRTFRNMSHISGTLNEALFYITCCTSDHITSCQTSWNWNNGTWHKTFVT